MGSHQVVMKIHNLELRHSRFVCNTKVQCKGVKNTANLLSVIMLLIERHVVEPDDGLRVGRNMSFN